MSAIRSFEMICDATLQEGPLHRMMVVRHFFNDYWARPRLSSAAVESLRVTESATGEAGGQPSASAKRIISQKHVSLPLVCLLLTDFYSSLINILHASKITSIAAFQAFLQTKFPIWKDKPSYPPFQPSGRHSPTNTSLRKGHRGPANCGCRFANQTSGRRSRLPCS
jgi:hypothetical protein